MLRSSYALVVVVVVVAFRWWFERVLFTTVQLSNARRQIRMESNEAPSTRGFSAAPKRISLERRAQSDGREIWSQALCGISRNINKKKINTYYSAERTFYFDESSQSVVLWEFHKSILANCHQDKRNKKDIRARLVSQCFTVRTQCVCVCVCV